MRLIRLPEVMARVGLKKTALYERVSNGSFPAPVKLGAASAWVEEEVDRWVGDQVSAARRANPRT